MIVAAAVVAFGNSILIRAQDGVTGGHSRISRIDYRFANVGPIEFTDFRISELPPPADPCCPPWNSAILEEALSYHGSGDIGADYTLVFTPSEALLAQIQAYVTYLHSLNPDITNITIQFRLHDAGTGSAPTAGPQVGDSHYVTWSFDGTSDNAHPDFFSLANEPMQVNRWYRIHTGIYLEGGQTFFPVSCANNDIDVRLQVQGNARGDVRGVLQSRSQLGRISEKTLPRD